VIPPDVQGLVADLPSSAARDYLDFARAAFERFHGRSGRLRFMIAPSAPQRCTVELMQAADELARAHGSPFHTHILETKTQWVTGREFYGKSLIRYMHDLGLLYRGTTIAHSVWVTDEDIALMGAAQCSIVHNCISNQKLGAGVAPLRRLIDAGVNVALGSDGIASNDTPRIFDVMHAAGILHNVAAPDNSKWVSATEILQAATINGARSALIEGETGSLEPGKKADLLLVGMRGVNFTPLNDVRNHLVYCENGSSIERVFVNGETVVENGRLTRVNDEGLLDELRELLPAFQVEHAEVERKNRVFHPYFAEIHRRSTIQDIGINRYAGDLPLWPGANR
jgi:5-methylthioadenosine/S-adenosylhomocysteine deaminase